jgi:CII-binding regulator of phage lambda lysogenization HflD
LENGRLIKLERQLSETLAALTERDRHIAQLTHKLAQATKKKSELQAKLAQVEPNAEAEAASSYTKLEGGTYYVTNSGTQKCVVLAKIGFEVHMDANTGNDKQRVGKP